MTRPVWACPSRSASIATIPGSIPVAAEAVVARTGECPARVPSRCPTRNDEPVARAMRSVAAAATSGGARGGGAGPETRPARAPAAAVPAEKLAGRSHRLGRAELERDRRRPGGKGPAAVTTLEMLVEAVP